MSFFEVCNIFRMLCLFSSDFTETKQGLTVDGMSIDANISTKLIQLKEWLILNQLTSSVSLTIDSIPESWEDCEFEPDDITEWKLSLPDKVSILKIFELYTADFEELLFINVDYFSVTWLQKHSLLSTPELAGTIEVGKPIKIWVHGLPEQFGGPKISILNTDIENQESNNHWLTSTKLPSQSDVLQSVHFINANVITILPEQYLITWGGIDCSNAKIFRRASTIYLLMCLCQEYYSSSKVVLNGTKRVETVLYDSSSFPAISLDEFEGLKSTVEWCYADSESDKLTKVLLVIDRISLDLKDDASLLDSLDLFSRALKEAKTKYKYVIQDRKKDYVKELSELQKDISDYIDKVSESAISYSSSFLKDLLAMGFVLTAGVLSRNIVQQEVLKSEEAEILFKAFGLYLALSLFLKFSHGVSSFLQSQSLFYYWREVLSTHMSIDDLEERINTSLKPIKIRFWATYIFISLLYLVLAVFSFNAKFTFGLIGVT